MRRSARAFLGLVAGLTALGASGCTLLIALSYPDYEINFATHRFSAEPVNLGDINSAYDDKNVAAPPELSERFSLVFSSRRSGQGFDLVVGQVSVSFNQDSGSLSVWSTAERQFVDRRLAAAADAMNDPAADELGPIPGEDPTRSFLFASDREGGDQDIYWIGARLDGGWGSPRAASALNTPGYEAYPTLHGSVGAVYFASDRGGGGLDLYGFRGREHELRGLGEVAPLAALNSTGDDTCPFVVGTGDRLLFASNRPGGLGGYDIYCARWTDGAWSAPLNLGAPINTAHDEFRPVVVAAPEFENDLLIFSSDRPGGRGGFDLYCAGFARSGGGATEHLERE